MALVNGKAGKMVGSVLSNGMLSSYKQDAAFPPIQVVKPTQKTSNGNKMSRSTAKVQQVVDNAGAAVEQSLLTHSKLAVVIDTISTSVMMIDRDFVVNYVNESTRSMLRRYASEFATIWPSFNTQEIIGTCIDTFHKEPSHQRRMLSDPRNLPHTADISVGSLRFSLSVNATYDNAGNYDGNILEWSEITERYKQELASLEYKSQIAAINKSQATIEFAMDGTVTAANEIFLHLLGYTLDEVKGLHHRMFVDPVYASSSAYVEFWDALRRGEYQAAEFKRVGKGGKQVWIQASYNPILDRSGKPAKVVKFATDVTAQVAMRESMGKLLASIGDVSVTIAGSAEELTNVSQEMSMHADATSQQANSVSETSARVSANVNIVAASSEEMMVSIRVNLEERVRGSTYR